MSTSALLIDNLLALCMSVVRIPDLFEAGLPQVADRGKQFAVPNVSVVFNYALNSTCLARDDLSFKPERLEAKIENHSV